VPIACHHTGKPIKIPDGHPITLSDLQYAGLGASAQCNWAREVGVITGIPVIGGHPTFNLSFCKRRKDAGLRRMNGGESTPSITIEHAPEGICWRQRGELDESELAKKTKPGRNGNRESISKLREVQREQSKSKEEVKFLAFQSLVAQEGGKVTVRNVKRIAQALGKSPSTVWRLNRKLKRP
jgi:hypothetical protein